MISQVWKLAEELITTEVLLNEYINLQDSLYSEAVILTEGLQEGTPRFLSDKIEENPEEETEDPVLACFKSINYIKRSLGRAMDMETGIVNQYKSFVSKIKGKSSILDLPGKKTFKKGCGKCEEYQQVLDKFDEDLEKCKKNSAGLNVQNTKLQKELGSYKTMYSELKISHDELINELRSKVSYSDEGEHLKKPKFLNTKQKTLDFTELKTMEKTLMDISKKYELEMGKNKKLQDSYENLIEETEVKQDKIERAQVIIKKLNEECEKLAKELFKVEEELDYYKKDSKGAEKVFFEARKKFVEIEGIKKIEERLREENLALKEKFLELSETGEAEKNHLKMVIEGLIYDKKSLEKDMEELEEKLNEIDEMNRDRAKAFSEMCEQNRALGESLAKKEEENVRNEEMCRLKVENQAAEMESIKKHAENLIRSLSNSKPHEDYGKSGYFRTGDEADQQEDCKHGRGKNVEKYKTESFAGQGASSNFHHYPGEVRIKDLETQLLESKNRELGFQSSIQNLLEKEKETLNSQSIILQDLYSKFLSEQEQVKMRCEELETLLSNQMNQINSLFRALSDYPKLIQVKDKQLEDLQEILNSNILQNESQVNYLQDEIKRLSSVIKDDILPKSSQIFDQQLDLAHKKIKNGLTENERLKIEFEGAKEINDRSLYRVEIAQNEFHQLSRTCARLEQELYQIKSSVENPAQAITYEPLMNSSTITSEILQKIKEIYEYNLALISQRTEARTALEKLEKERQLFVGELNLIKENLQAKEKMMQEEQIRLNEQADYLKDQINKEKEGKLRVQDQWEEEINFFKAQVDYIKNILKDTEKDKYRIEAELNQSKNDYKELLEAYERIQVEKNIVQKCYEELNNKIWSSSERLRTEWKKDSLSNSEVFK